MPLAVEDLARTALVRILPRSRYRLAAQSDSRFQVLAPNTSRIAYRQQGGTPAFLLFSGPGQDPRAAAAAAAAWAEANWRPNAIQRTVRPGVVVVQVAPAAELVPAGIVANTAIPAAVWTVAADTGRVEIAGSPPGSPSGGEIRRAAESLLRGAQAPSLGELDLAERSVMQVRTVAMPRLLTGTLGIVVVLFAFRFGLAGVMSLLTLPAEVLAGGAGRGSTALIVLALLAANVLLLAGIVLGAALLFNFRNAMFRLPGFSSPIGRTRNLTWAGYGAVMLTLAIAVEVALPAAERSSQGTQASFTHVAATVDDDGGELAVAVGGDLTVNLSGWPASEWAGVTFKTSNPDVLTLDSQSSVAPTARFVAEKSGVARVDAASPDGKYTFQVRVDVVDLLT